MAETPEVLETRSNARRGNGLQTWRDDGGAKPRGYAVEEPGGAVRLLSSRAPAFDVIDPPSNAAATFRPWYP